MKFFTAIFLALLIACQPAVAATAYLQGNSWKSADLTKTFTPPASTSTLLGAGLGSIVNADVNASAAIAVSKLAAVTASRALVSDGSGFVSPATTTATEIGYVNGVTSAIQTQMNLKAPLASPTFTGTVTLPATVTGAAAQVITLPTSTSTLATLALTENLSNKTLISPTASGDITMSGGGGIKFPATQVASANANTLDDYEEGTFTPSIAGASTPGTPTYVTRLGVYSKIGNQVTATINLNWTALSGGVGGLTVTGLPFAANSTYSHSCSVGYVQDLTMTAAWFMVNYISGGANTAIQMVQVPTGGGGTNSIAIDTSAQFMVTCNYTM